MKEIVIFLITAVFLCCMIDSCNNCLSEARECKHDTVYINTVITDTISVSDDELIDSLRNELRLCKDTLRFYQDSVIFDDYMNARKIQKIKYYIDICDKRSANKQFFFGWIKRTMSE